MWCFFIVRTIIGRTYISVRYLLADTLGKMRNAETKYMANHFPIVQYHREITVTDILHKRVVSNPITKLVPHTKFNAGQRNLQVPG